MATERPKVAKENNLPEDERAIVENALHIVHTVMDKHKLKTITLEDDGDITKK